MELETVKVKSPEAPEGWYLLNKSDFDPSAHELFEPEAETKSKAKAKGKASDPAAQE